MQEAGVWGVRVGFKKLAQLHKMWKLLDLYINNVFIYK